MSRATQRTPARWRLADSRLPGGACALLGAVARTELDQDRNPCMGPNRTGVNVAILPFLNVEIASFRSRFTTSRGVAENPGRPVSGEGSLCEPSHSQVFHACASRPVGS